MDPYSLILECSDDEINLNTSLAKAADWMHADVKVIFECSGSHAPQMQYTYQFPRDEGLADYDSLTGFRVIDEFTYDPEAVARVLNPPGFCGDSKCDTPKENCGTCATDCSCATGGICDINDANADAAGCVATPAPVAPELCYNALDDDGDGDLDCDDSDCAADENCYFKVTGTVRTALGRPMKNVKVSLLDSFSGVVYLETHTDVGGNFEIDYSSMAKGWGMPSSTLPAKLRVELTDKLGQVQVLWDFGKANEPYAAETMEVGLPTKEHFDLTMRMSNTVWSVHSFIVTPGYDTHWDASQIYYDSLRLFDFVRNELGYPYAYGGNPLPVKIYIYSSETTGAFYSPALRGGGIFMSPLDSRHQNHQCPENCVWHELFHFTMYNKYGAWSSYGGKGANHEGFKNNNTGDSYEEGFAEFWPLILSKGLDGATDAVYGGFANLELNYNPWMAEGLDEELAVASLFWDLVDSSSDTGDNLAFSHKELWSVLMSKRLVSMKEVYDELQKKWPDSAVGINEVFVAHGFFKDTFKGNGTYDAREPYWDADPPGPAGPNGKWDVGEVYVDIGTPGDGLLRPHQVFTDGQDRIGTSSNYGRTTRNSPRPFIPDSFVKVDGAPSDALFKVSYSFADPSLNYESYGIVDNETGHVFIELPPEGYDMTAIVTIDNYEGAGSISVTPDDYYSLNTPGQGFMKQGTIPVGAKKSGYCNNNGVCEDPEASACGDCSANVPATTAIGTGTGTTGTTGTGAGTGITGTGTAMTQPTTTGAQKDLLDQISGMLGIDKTLMLAIGGILILLIIVLIAVAAKRHGRKPKQPQQAAYPQQTGNVIVIRQ